MKRCCCCGHRIEWEPSATGPHHGTVWFCPRWGLDASVYYDGPPDAGFYLGSGLKLRTQTGPQIIEELFRLFPLARVPRDR